MAQLYTDENFPYPVVQELRRLGHEVITLQEEGKAGQSISDEEVLKLACEKNRAILTLNRKHFVRLHQKNLNHKGIVVCSFDPNFEGQALRIHTILETEKELTNKLIRVNRF